MAGFDWMPTADQSVDTASEEKVPFSWMPAADTKPVGAAPAEKVPFSWMPTADQKASAKPTEPSQTQTKFTPIPQPFTRDLKKTMGAGIDVAQADIQKALTGFGAGDFSKEEAANRAEAERTRAEISAPRREATEALRWDETGPHGFTPTGVALKVAESIVSPATVASIGGGILQRSPNPLMKAAGLAAASGVNALQIAGSSAQGVQEAGGTPEQVKSALLPGAFVGGTGGALDALLLGKLAGVAGLDKAAAKNALKTLALNGDQAAIARLTVIAAEEAAAKAAPLATRAAEFSKEAIKTIGVGAAGEGMQEYYEEGGQAVVENVALGKPSFEGAHARGMLGGTLGAIAGGTMGGGAHVATRAVQALTPEAAPGTATTVGADVAQTQEQVPGVTTGSAGDVNLQAAADKVNATIAEATDTGPLNAATAVGEPGAINPEKFNDLAAAPKVSENINNLLNAGLDTTPIAPATRASEKVSDKPISPQLEALLRRSAAEATPQVAEDTTQKLTRELGTESLQPEVRKGPTGLPETESPWSIATPGTKNFRKTTDADVNAFVDGIVSNTIDRTDPHAIVFQEAHAPQIESKLNEIAAQGEEVTLEEPLINQQPEIAPTSISEVPQGQAAQIEPTSAPAAQVPEKLTALTPNTLQYREIEEDPARYELHTKTGGVRVQSRFENGKRVNYIDPRDVELLEAAQAAGKTELADALTERMGHALNHEDIHGAVKSDNGVYTPAFNALLTEVANPLSRANPMVRSMLPILLKNKTYQSAFNKILGRPEETVVTADDVMNSPRVLTKALDELLAGHPNPDKRVSEDDYANYTLMRTALLQRVLPEDVADKLINTPIATRLDKKYLGDIAELMDAKKKLSYPETKSFIRDALDALGKLERKVVGEGQTAGTVQHIASVKATAKSVADRLGITGEQRVILMLAAEGHDLGKGVSEEMLRAINSKTKLTEAEGNLVRTHADETKNILTAAKAPEAVVVVAAEHHTPVADMTPQFKHLSLALKGADVLDSLIGGPGHEYPMTSYVTGEVVPRTAKGIKTLLDEDVTLGNLDQRTVDVLKAMLDDGDLTKTQKAQLARNEAKAAEALATQEAVPVQEVEDETAPNSIQQIGEEIARQTDNQPFEGSSVTGADSYYTDAAGKPVASKAQAASSGKLDLSRLESIVKRAVTMMHTLAGNESGTVTRINDTTYKVGDATYTLERDGNNFRVVPAGRFDPNHDVTIENEGDKYFTRVDKFTSSKGETALQARVKQYIKEGTAGASAFLKGRVFDREDVKGVVAAFTDKDGKQVEVTVSALRKIGAAVAGRPNDTLDNRLQNVKDGISQAIADIGPMVGPDVKSLIVSEDPAVGRVRFSEAESLSNQDQVQALKASRREEAAKTILSELRKFKRLEAIALEYQDDQNVSDLAKELNGELKNNPKLDTKAWLQDVQKKANAVAKNISGIDEAPEALAGQDQYARTLVSDEPLTDVENPLRRPATPPSTRGIKAGKIKNNSSLGDAMVQHLDGLTAKLRILTSFTLHDSVADVSLLPEFARKAVEAHPDQSQFIAVDDAATGHREHIIYIATKNADGSARSDADIARDVAHEYGHFVQRAAMDFIVRSATLSGSIDSQNLVAGLLGLELAEGQNPLLAYQNMNADQRGVIEELFADRLAAEMLQGNKELDVDGQTFLDVVQASDAKTFFQGLASILKQIFASFRGQKNFTGNFNDFLVAMTGREKTQYTDLVEAMGRTSVIRQGRKNIVQFQGGRPAPTSVFKKLMDSRLAQSIATGFSHWYGVDSELWSMKSDTAKWIARTFSGSTGDVMRKGFKDNWRKFTDISWGGGVIREENGIKEYGLGDKFTPLIHGLPVYGKSLFGISTKSTPIGDAFMKALHEQNSLQAPLWAIPDVNYTVEQTIDGKKNVTLNLRETVGKLREYYTKDLYNYQTAEGMPLPKIENYYPFEMTRETVMNFEKEIRAALKKNIVQEAVWVKKDGQDVQELIDEAPWTDRKIDDFIESYRTGVAIDRDPFAGESDTETMKAKTRAAMGHVGILGGQIADVANNAKKARKLSPARRQVLMPFSEADPASLIMKRTGESIKSRATDHMWGSWVVPGGKLGSNTRLDFSLLSRAEYKEWVAAQYRQLNDAIVTAYGRPDLTDAKINEAKANGEFIRERIEARKRLLEISKDPDATNPRVKAVQEALKAALDRNYYSTFAKIDAALAAGEDSGDISLTNAIRIKEVILPAMLGRLGQQEMSASWRAAQAYAMSGMNVSYLPLMALSALAEFPQIGIRFSDPILGNGAFKSQAKMLRTLGEMIVNPNGEIKQEAETILKAIGLIKESAVESALTTSSEGEFLPTKVKHFNQQFFEYTQIKRLTEFERKVAYKLGKDALMQYARQARSGGPAAAQAQAQADAVGLDVDEALRLMGDNEAWINSKNFQDAIYNWVDEANLRPGPHTRPARMSDPRFAMIWYLKDFSWGMQAKTLTFLVQQSRLQPSVVSKLMPWVTAAIPMMIAGAIGAFARDLLTNRGPAALLGIKPSDRYDDASARVASAINKSGMLAQFEMLFMFAQNFEHRGLPWVSLAGPIPSLLQEAAATGSRNTFMRHLPGISMLAAPVKKEVLKDLGLGPAYKE